VQAEHGLVALAAADTMVVPGYPPLDDPGKRVSWNAINPHLCQVTQTPSGLVTVQIGGSARRY
jgi:hypothetical protein